MSPNRRLEEADNEDAVLNVHALLDNVLVRTAQLRTRTPTRASPLASMFPLRSRLVYS